MKLNIISFNIRCCDDPDVNSIEERSKRLYKVLSGYDADIIGFQEYRPAWESYIEEYFGDKYELFNKYRARTGDVESSPILWNKDKFECEKTGYFWLSDTPETESKGWDELYDCYRICLYTILKDKKTGQRFNFMNTHFGFGDNGQVKSSKLIKEYSLKIQNENDVNATIVVGDFNMNPKTLGYGEMIKHFTDLNAVTENDLRDTYHGYHPEEFKDEHIDYCFINEKVKPVSQKIIDELVDGKFPSDHFGLNIKVEI